MTAADRDPQLQRLQEWVEAEMGLQFSEDRHSDLMRGIAAASKEFGLEDTSACIEWLLSSSARKEQIEVLAGHITVGETYFFRDEAICEGLQKDILPGLIEARRGKDQRLRIWSAGCSSGEEPYSIAIMLSHLLVDRNAWNITILGTDINRRALSKATTAKYSKWSFRGTSPSFVETYFSATGDGRYELRPDIKKMVTFSYLNLVEDSYPSILNGTNAIDLVCCRNVLMYFTEQNSSRVIKKLHHCMVDGAWLIVSAVEASQRAFSDFVAQRSPSLTLYRRTREDAGEREPTSPAYSRSPTPARGPDIRPAVAPQAGILPAKIALPAEIPHPPETAPLASERSEPPIEIDVPPPAVEQSPYSEALALYEEGEYQRAAETLASSISVNGRDRQGRPASEEMLILLSRAHANAGQLETALEWCERAIAVHELSPCLHYLRATILQEQGRIVEATRSLKRTLYLDQGFVVAHFALGLLTRQQGKLRESERHFRNALSVAEEHDNDEMLPESEGLTAGRMAEIIRFTSEGTAA